MSSDPHTIRTFSVPTSDSGTILPMRIVEPAVSSDNLPLATWASSFVLASALYKLDLARHLSSLRLSPTSTSSTSGASDGKLAELSNKLDTLSLSEPSSSSSSSLPELSPTRIHPIVELGAGTGLVGLTAAALLGATHATLTDRPGIVPGVAANIAVNAELLLSRRCVVRAGALDWSDPAVLEYPLTGPASSLPRRLVAAQEPVRQEPQGDPEAAVQKEAQGEKEKEKGKAREQQPDTKDVATTAASEDPDLDPGSGSGSGSGTQTPKSPFPSTTPNPISNLTSTLTSSLTTDRYKARLIFAADTVYDAEHPELLTSVVSTWLERGPDARFIICYPLRVAYLDYVRELWEKLEALGMEAEIEGRAEGDETNGDDEMLCEYVVWKWREEGKVGQVSE